MSSPDDLNLAQRYMAGTQGANTAYFRGQWRRYQGGVWQPINEYVLKLELLRVMAAAEGIRSTANKLSSVERILRSVLFVGDDKVDANTDLINLENGVYSINNDELKPHSPKDYMTTQLPFAYDTEATAPLWGMYLNSTFVNPIRPGEIPQVDTDLVTFLKQAVGYSLTTDVSHHVTFFALGEGANGKGVLFHVLSALAGESAMPLSLNMLSKDSYQLAQLAGVRIALCSESKKKNLLEDDILKSLVGGDPMNVRQIRQEPFVLHPVCKLWLATNNLPIVTDTTEGIWRRILAIPFNRLFYDRRRGIDDRTLDLKEQLENELPGIFNWAMEGLHSLRDRNKFLIPKQVANLTDGYRYQSNTVEMFVSEECAAVPSGSIILSALYADYSSWSKSNGFGQKSRTTFSTEIERLGFPVERTEGGSLLVQGLSNMRGGLL